MLPVANIRNNFEKVNGPELTTVIRKAGAIKFARILPFCWRQPFSARACGGFNFVRPLLDTKPLRACVRSNRARGKCERISGEPMRIWNVVTCVGIGIGAMTTLWAFREPFREFPGVEYRVGDVPLPADWQDKTEWVFA